jgi:hypothetical protein
VDLLASGALMLGMGYGAPRRYQSATEPSTCQSEGW